MRVIDDEGGGIVFHHLSDGLLVDVVTLVIDVGAEEVLEAVLDLRPWSKHRYPFLGWGKGGR